MILYDNKKGVLKDVDIKPFKKEIKKTTIVKKTNPKILKNQDT